jgi:SNF2 family DNA or RNA helicase
MKFYQILKKQMTISAAGEEVTAVNAATNINKLLQISGGAVYTDNREVIEFDVSNRIQVILEVIQEASHKVLVFVPFTHTIELLRSVLEKNNISCGVINGQVSVNKRSELVTQFQNQADPHVLIIQPQAASHGLTLTAADTIIWYAPVTSVETYLQANARINRPGQKNAMSIVHIKGSEVESRLYHMLQNNITNHEKIVDLYRQEISQDI